MNELMLDIETLGTTSYSVVLSIGAVKFTEEAGIYSEFYTMLACDEELDHKASVEAATLFWWTEQSERLPLLVTDTTLMNPNKTRLREFKDFCEGVERFWCKGPHFDIAILDNCLKRYGHSLPWKYYQVRDYRTLVDVAKTAGYYQAAVPVENARKHHALHDARTQAEHVVTMLRVLNGLK